MREEKGERRIRERRLPDCLLGLSYKLSQQAILTL
jgi:hypothetical protein